MRVQRGARVVKKEWSVVVPVCEERKSSGSACCCRGYADDAASYPFREDDESNGDSLYSDGESYNRAAALLEQLSVSGRFLWRWTVSIVYDLLAAALPPRVLTRDVRLALARAACGALVLAVIKGQLNLERLRDVVQTTTQVTSMVFLILIGAAVFSLVFRGFGGEELVNEFFNELPGGIISATLLVMVVIFLLGFILDFIEITFVVVPIVAPVLLAMGLDPVWLGIMIAINLQTSFLTPPFGFALFYLRGVAPESIKTIEMYRGVIPFIAIQVFLMIMLSIFPAMATWLPSTIFG